MKIEGGEKAATVDDDLDNYSADNDNEDEGEKNIRREVDYGQRAKPLIKLPKE
ncbi:hypothetical protein MUCCIDRAFT_110404 [Mucor lusitanicus CBS 277.49]|uniref:Uncharacterized protein n=1 Tax=Mucor lusitanicus CBS 277.49 TaxID=747725 RepID=A0A168LHF9_MUCCL|nr:hypothetical protein MUCCIDRAFT_110404 [Mucor lusitanicus CBS 277.49]